MSELLQSGHHPDADRLSAFVEQALPSHERQEMLAHLAVCPECRTVLALSLPEVDESPLTPAEPARKPWFAGWNLAWPAVAAVAALAVFIVYINSTSTNRNRIASNTQTAASHPPAPPASTEQSPIDSLKSPLLLESKSRSTGGGGVSAGAAEKSAKGNAQASIRAESIAAAPIKGRDFSAENGLLQATPPPALPAASNRQAVTQATSPAASHSEAAKAEVGGGGGAISLKAEPPAASSNGILNATLNAPALDQTPGIPAPQPLPSRLPVLSMATLGRQILAIDSHHAVYLSGDAGQHWRAIPVQWTGRATSATLVSYVATRGSDAGTVQGGAIAAFSSAGRTPAAMPGSSLTGTVTDATGAAVAGASVVVSDAAGHTARTVSTDREGRYRVDGLTPGAYRVEAQAPGFNKKVLAAVPVSAAQQNVTNVSLAVGAASETVTVEADDRLAAKPYAAQKAMAKPATAGHSAPVFEIMTDNGDRWTSSDGVTWARK